MVVTRRVRLQIQVITLQSTTWLRFRNRVTILEVWRELEVDLVVVDQGQGQLE